MTNASASTFVARRAERAVVTALEDTRVVLVEGPRQAGKTTLVRKFVNSQRPFLSLDDPVILARNLDGAVIDEIQRAPELMLVIKQSVDTDTRPGRFLLTGSANVMALPTIGDSLAGRIEIVELFPFAQSELLGRGGDAVDRFFSNESIRLGDPVIGQNLAEIVARGGYPEAIGRKDERRRVKWFTDYLALTLDRDVRDIATIDQLEKLPLLVRLLAEQSGQLSNHTNMASALQISRATVARYIETLERMFLIDTLPPWYSNRISRLIKTPKHHFLDSGLLAALRQFSPAPPQADPVRFGPLLESFVGSELRKLIGWSDARVTLSHFRTKDGDEVDFVLEDQQGRIVGIEVKASATLRRGDFSGLRKLEAAAGDKFVRGLVLHDHDGLRPVSEKLSGVPVSVLWAA
jgi:predicted AAA+ superfamily ATPase